MNVIFGVKCHSIPIRRRKALMAVDPVCGSHVDEQAAHPAEEYTSDYAGQTFYFCSDDCKATFDATPEQYARKAS